MISIAALNFLIFIYSLIMLICFAKIKALLRYTKVLIMNRIISIWLCKNKLSVNVDKSNFVIFHHSQTRVPFDFLLSIKSKPLNQKYCTKYLGVLIDANLNWKNQVDYIAKKIKRNVGILFRPRDFLNTPNLVNLYHAPVYPFLIYGIIAWGNTYPTTLQSIYTFQKRT